MDPLHGVCICRLCLGNGFSLVDIFKQVDMKIVDVLSKHIGEVTRTDALPKFICTACLEKVNAFHEFYCGVHAGQQDFIQNWVKDENQSSTDNVAPSTSPSATATNVATGLNDNMDICHIVVKPDLASMYMENSECDGDEMVTDEVEHAEASGEIPSILVEDIDVIERNSDDESLNDSDDDEEKQPKYGKVDKETVAAVIAEHFNRTCDLCPVELKSLKRAISHYRTEHNIDQGYLSCCGRRFKKLTLVEDHVRWHLNPNVFQCSYCDKALNSRTMLSAHHAEHKNTKSFACDVCNKVFVTRTRLRRHMQSHIKREMGQKKCQLCSAMCADEDKLRLHMKEVHNKASDDVDAQLKRLEEYIKTTKIDTLQLMLKHFDMKCEYCEDYFNTLEEAQYHYHEKHGVAEGYVRCCGHRFKKSYHARIHLLWHMQPELFKCTVCGAELDSWVSFRRHADKHYGANMKDKQRVKCTECGKSCYAQYLAAHMRKHQNDTMNLAEIQSEENLKKFFDMKCDKCPMELSSLQHAKVHYAEHGIDCGYIKCCGKEFRNLGDVKDHLTYHFYPDIFTCQICNKVYERKVKMQACILKHRAIETGKYKCDVCNRAFGANSELQRHKRTKHEQTPENIDPCCRVFVTEKARSEHIRRDHKKQSPATAEKLFVCEFCARPFQKMYALQAHIKNLHSEPEDTEQVQCDVCQKWMKSSHSLNAHMKRHSSGPQTCPICNKQSSNSDALKQHIKRVHEAQCTYQCHLCPKAFKFAAELKDHIASHNDTRCYTCSFCPETFNWRTNMYKHQKKMHPAEWEASRQGRSRPGTSWEN